jgi:hypothetical protein
MKTGTLRQSALCLEIGIAHQQNLNLQGLWASIAELHQGDYHPEFRFALGAPRDGVRGHLNRMTDYCTGLSATMGRQVTREDVWKSFQELARLYAKFFEQAKVLMKP